MELSSKPQKLPCVDHQLLETSPLFQGQGHPVSLLECYIIESIKSRFKNLYKNQSFNCFKTEMIVYHKSGQNLVPPI